MYKLVQYTAISIQVQATIAARIDHDVHQAFWPEPKAGGKGHWKQDLVIHPTKLCSIQVSKLEAPSTKVCNPKLLHGCLTNPNWKGLVSIAQVPMN
jgi:hypothetical protein